METLVSGESSNREMVQNVLRMELLTMRFRSFVILTISASQIA